MKTKQRAQYLLLSGIGLLTIVVLILVASPDLIFSPTVTVIGNNLNKSTENQLSVVTKTDLGDPEQVAKFPYDIGKWHGVDYDTTATQKALNANIVLLRGYDPETFTQPLFLSIVQSKSNSSFHPPEICYPSQGYKIQEYTQESLLITNPNWSKGEQTLNLPLNKLIVIKSTPSGELRERRVVLFFYIKGNQFYSDMITMVETQGLAPLQGSYEGTLKEEKEFITQITPLLFEPGKESGQMLISSLSQKGISGYLIIVLMLIIPIGLITTAVIRRRGP